MREGCQMEARNPQSYRAPQAPINIDAPAEGFLVGGRSVGDGAEVVAEGGLAAGDVQRHRDRRLSSTVGAEGLEGGWRTGCI